MCGRYNITDNPAVHALLQQLGIELGPLPTRYNVAPTEPTLTIVGGDRAELLDMRWWFTPAWVDEPSTKYSMFNAKSETLASSRAFRGAFKYRRGIVPVSSFIEWQHKDGQKQPFLITNADHCLFLAAVWELWNEELFSCAIVTTAACEAFEAIHSRQPVILDQQEALTWLSAKDTSELSPMMQSRDLSQYLHAPIDKAIGNSRNKQTPTLLADWRTLGAN